MIREYEITPAPAPRQVGSDAWKERKCVKRYREFRDLVHIAGVQVPYGGAHITFWLPMPESWPKYKKAAMLGQPHQQKPDVDNLVKALLDGVFRNKDDAVIWDLRATKKWGDVGKIVIEIT